MAIDLLVEGRVIGSQDEIQSVKASAQRFHSVKVSVQQFHSRRADWRLA